MTFRPATFAVAALFLVTSGHAGAADTYPREAPIVRAVRKVGSAVVNISSEVSPRKRPNPFSGFGPNPFLDEFFWDFFEPCHQGRPQRTSLGSGVIIDADRCWISTAN
jgi:S1-C subfamily serine protease